MPVSSRYKVIKIEKSKVGPKQTEKGIFRYDIELEQLDD